MRVDSFQTCGYTSTQVAQIQSPRLFQGGTMECKQTDNMKNCNCSYEPCPRKGICCDCLQYHLNSRQLPACCFPADAERSYDRSLKWFQQSNKLIIMRATWWGERVTETGAYFGYQERLYYENSKSILDADPSNFGSSHESGGRICGKCLRRLP